MAPSKRENFGSSLTFILAMAGSAIGLGNIWRFPFMVGEHGGGAFIVAYIICGLCIALPCFICEALIGRRARSGVFGAFGKLAPGAALWKGVGAVCVFTSFIVISYYCVVGGWSLDFLIRAVTGRLGHGNPEAATGVFSRMASSSLESLSMMIAFFVATALIVFGGIKKGIEKFTKITTPLLFFLMLAIVVYSVSLPGSGEGVRYLVKPDFSKLDASGWAAALGQAFYSMSLGVGTVLIYSSFMRKSDNIVYSGFWTSISDTGFALISGFAIMPAVFAAGIEPGAGPALVYETLPYIFSKMGLEAPVLSYIITIVFFLAILAAALTSSISMFDVSVEHAVEQFGLKRWQAVMLFLVLGITVGGVCALSFGALKDVKLFGLTAFELCDYVCSNILMTLGALAFVLFVGWRMKKSDVYDELTSGGSVTLRQGLFRFLYFVIRWIIPPVIIVIFVSNLLG
ncbi:MAG: sodium-dependent transporter [Bacteroidales bacterium]|nr:sodium-dependent transporter [Bacteroidales bacterium]